MAEITKFRGMLLGAACGDALGYPLDSMPVKKILRQYGPFGLRTLVRTKKTKFLAPMSAHTQMMLATADGLFWASAKDLDCSEGMYRGYMRWFYSQTGEEPRRGQRTWLRRQPYERAFCLAREKFMHARRGMCETSLAALESAERGSMKNKVNESDNGEAIARNGPIGLYYAGRPKEAFYEGVRGAVLTHSNPSAYLAAASFAGLIASLAGGVSLPKSLAALVTHLTGMDNTDELLALIEAAVQQANQHPAGTSEAWAHLDSIRSIGTGATAAEALAIAIYCIMACDDPFEAVLAAANHDGKSCLTAALCGALEGVRFGEAFLPASWTANLEGAELIALVGDTMYATWQKNS